MFRLLGVKKKFSGREIIQVGDLTIGPGFHWIRGANGSGKTTLLKIFAGLMPFDGVIELDGISLKQEPLNYRRRVSWAEAEPQYPPFLTGAELVGFTRDIRQASAKQVFTLIERFEVTDYLHRPTGTYSSGMMKRLSLLIAFIGPGSVILLDEPLLTLDTGIAAILQQLMVETVSENGTGFIYSSHQAFPRPGFSSEHCWLMAGQTLVPQ